jgi:hypothetical protein
MLLAKDQATIATERKRIPCSPQVKMKHIVMTYYFFEANDDKTYVNPECKSR